MADDDGLAGGGTAALTNSASVVGAVGIGQYEAGPVLVVDEMCVTRLGVDTTGAMVLIQSIELCRTGGDPTFDEMMEDRSRRPVVVSAAAVAWLSGKEFRQHLVAISRLRHSHIVTYSAVLMSPLRLHFVSPYAAGGPLMNAVRTRFLERYRADEREDSSGNDDEGERSRSDAGRWFFRSRMSEDEARFYFQQLVSAIRYAHEGCGIAHGNLSLDCLLLEGQLPSDLSHSEIDKFSYQRRPRLRVASWGLAAVRAHSRLAENLFNAEQLSSWVESVQSTSAGLERCVQRTNFVAPELLVPSVELAGAGAATAAASPTAPPPVVTVTDEALKKADVWSCGVILYAMICGSLPFALRQNVDSDEALLSSGDGGADTTTVWTSVSALQQALGDLVHRINFASFSFPKHVSRGVRGARHLIANMMVPDASKRFSWDQVIAHPWFDVRVEKTLFPVRPTSATTSTIWPASNLL